MAKSSRKPVRKNLTIKQIAKLVLPVLNKNGVKKASVFGSYARGEAKRRSDVDILIPPPKGMGFKFAGLKLELPILKKKIYQILAQEQK